MKKSELIEAINDHVANPGISKTGINWVLDTLGDVVRHELGNNGEVTIPGLIKLSVTQRAERQGRNPQTGEAITISARRVPKIKALKVLKDVII